MKITINLFNGWTVDVIADRNFISIHVFYPHTSSFMSRNITKFTVSWSISYRSKFVGLKYGYLSTDWMCGGFTYSDLLATIIITVIK